MIVHLMIEQISEETLIQFPQYVHNVGFYRFTPYQILIDLMLRESIGTDSLVLDAGSGRNSVLPESAHGVAVDILRESVRVLKKQRSDLACICASIEMLPFKEASFDVVVSRDVLEHCDSDSAFREICNVLKQEGRFIASTSNLFSFAVLLDQLLGPIADLIATKEGSHYFRRTRHLNPYSLKFELYRAGLAVEKMFFVTTPPLLTAQTWRVFVKRVPWKLIPWLFVSLLFAHFQIFKETLVVNAIKYK